MAGSKPLEDSCGQKERSAAAKHAVNAQPVMQEQGRYSTSGNIYTADTIRLKTHRACQGSNLEWLLVFLSGKKQQDITKGQKHGHGCQFLPKYINYLPWK